MDPTVVAAWIAAGVSVLTLAGTLAAQYFGRRGTKEDTEKAFAEQRRQLKETLKAQSEQLELTLGEQRTRTWNERFATAAGQLGDDKPAAVRLAGVYAMAGLAADWAAGRQTCVDVLCAYLRMPYQPDPGEDSTIPEQHSFQAIREIRHTVIRVITARLRDDSAASWQGLNFDFTGVVFDGGSFHGAKFSGGTVSFNSATFPGGEVSFDSTEFSGGEVCFDRAEFSGGTVSFNSARFSGGTVSFIRAQFSRGTVRFDDAEFSDSEVRFSGARFSGGIVSFDSTEFSGGEVRFIAARFSGGTVSFDSARFSGGTVSFIVAKFSSGEILFLDAEFSGGTVRFDSAGFSGGTVSFIDAGFSGGKVDFSAPKVWSHPPTFPWTDTPPPGVQLPSSGTA
jgi:Pentapeptide repeats (9 copies)